MLNMTGVIVSAKWMCAPPPRLVCMDDTLVFRISWTSAMVSYVGYPTIYWMEGKGREEKGEPSTIFSIFIFIVLKKLLITDNIKKIVKYDISN